jgi:hypothetical protein
VSSTRAKRLLAGGAAAAAALFLLLLIPDPAPPELVPAASRSPFAWNQNERWKALEARFRTADGTRTREALDRLRERAALLRGSPRPVEDPLFDEIEAAIFELAPLVAVAPGELTAYATLVSSIREAVKDQSVAWDVRSSAARVRLYRLLYGGRAAVEEAMLQAPAGTTPALLVCRDEPSQAPSAMVRGVRLHSGDILLSRGAAPTSALIARGNDFPGNFSHVALVHVDASTSAVSIIEAHIEKGVAVASVDEYLADPKLRVMALRLRSDHPALAKEPTAAHRAAERSLAGSKSRRVPYDFAMDFSDHSRIFCSEVASAAYEEAGITLWMDVSSLSSRGVCSWLSAFGVRSSLTQEPSDLEYDPQLRVVAEWRDAEGLLRDHLDNATTDVMLEGAERGEKLGHSAALLPLARVMKAWSWTLNRFGAVGPIPEGMSATVALRLQDFRARHAALKAVLEERVRKYKAERGAAPPYWELINLARTP